MLRTDIRVVELVGEGVGATQDIFEQRSEREKRGYRESFTLFFLEAQFCECFFLESHILEKNTSETRIFEENSHKQMLRLNGFGVGIGSDIPSFFQAMFRVESQFLAEICLQHNVGG